MNETPYGQWLRTTTGGKSSRDIADRISRALGYPVSHTTVQRWMKSGIPAPAVFELSKKFKVDPTTSVIQMGWITVEDIQNANLGFLLQILPTELLTAELHRRALEARPQHMEDEKPPTRSPGVPLGRSDAMRHQSFRLTGKES
jgi:transposase